MSMTMVGFGETSACDGLTKIAALADEHVRVVGDDLVVPTLNKVLATLVMSANVVEARLQSPSLRREWYQSILPLCKRAGLPTRAAIDEAGAATHVIIGGFPLDNHFRRPIELESSEKLNMLIDNGNNNELNNAIVILGDGVQAVELGDVRTVKFTTTGTCVGGKWTNLAITFDQALPSGKYALVGLVSISATGLATRAVFVGGTNRPGCFAQADISDERPDIFRHGNSGVWGEFEFDQPPTLDFLASGNDATPYGYMDLVLVREGR